MAHNSYKIDTSMGQVKQHFGHPLHFLTEQEQENLDTVGYSGKLNGVKTSREEYLNSLGKGSFSITQTKRDNGDFNESFVISHAE